MDLADVKNEEFRSKGFMVVRGVLSQDEIETLRQKADAIGADLDGYNERNKTEKARLAEQHKHETGGPVTPPTGGGGSSGRGLDDHPEVRLNDRHARRDIQVYPFRKRDVDPAVREAAITDDPYSRISTQISNLCDHDEHFRSVAAHPNIVSVLNEVLSPNVKMWFDHIWNKAPYNDQGPYRGANRFHQDGFFHLERRSVTCWLSLDGVTLENGPLHYVPLTADYGQFRFDGVASAVRGEATTAGVLEHTEVVTLEPGDAAFHDRWTLHATAPNESPTRRRGWALHYADAESRYGDFEDDPEGPPYTYHQRADGLHFRNGMVQGNRDWFLVSGKEFPGRI